MYRHGCSPFRHYMIWQSGCLYVYFRPHPVWRSNYINYPSDRIWFSGRYFVWYGGEYSINSLFVLLLFPPLYLQVKFSFPALEDRL